MTLPSFWPLRLCRAVGGVHGGRPRALESIHPVCLPPRGLGIELLRGDPCLARRSAVARYAPPGGLAAQLRPYFVGTGTVWLLATFLLRTSTLQAFRIPSGAMAPTLEIGDH